VFNCDEEFDSAAVGRIFSGLLRCGAWGCFDEFNRLDESVLSAVSQQIQQIQSALRSRSPTVTLLNTTCSVDANTGMADPIVTKWSSGVVHCFGIGSTRSRELQVGNLAASYGDYDHKSANDSLQVL
jgi:hypothetical protein